MDTKICSKCGVEKPLGEFYKVKRWIKNVCKKCEFKQRNEYAKTYEKRKEIQKNWRLKNPEKLKEYTLKYRVNRYKCFYLSRKRYSENFLTLSPSSKRIDGDGYVSIGFGSYATHEHLHLMRVHLKWCFSGKDGEVHHKNGIRTDNRIDNLEFIPKYPNKQKHRVIDELAKSLKTITEQEQEIAQLKAQLAGVRNGKN